MARGQQDPDPPVMSQRAPRNHTPSMLSTLEPPAGRTDRRYRRRRSRVFGAILCGGSDVDTSERAGRVHRVRQPKSGPAQQYSPAQQRRRQPGDPPPVLRCPARARQGVGGEHMAHQVVRAPTSTPTVSSRLAGASAQYAPRLAPNIKSRSPGSVPPPRGRHFLRP